MNTQPKKPTRKSLIKHFINKFEAIPEEQWCVRQRDNGRGQHCALGHVEITHGFEGCVELGRIFNAHEPVSSGRGAVADINNGYLIYTDGRGIKAEWLKPTQPKQRVLSALNDKLKEEL